MTDEDRRSLERTPSGIAGLDHLLGGGMFVGGVYLITGRPGAGKTIFASQYAFQHVAVGGRALYVTLLSESHARLSLVLENMSFFRPDAIGESLHYISGYQILEKERLAGLIKMLRTAVREHRASLLVIDGLLTAHEITDTELEFKKFIHELQVLAELVGCTMLLLRGAHDAESSYPERTMADGLLLLHSRRVGIRAVREIEVLKHRGSSQTVGASFYEISNGGIRIYPRIEAGIELDPRRAEREADEDREPDVMSATGVTSLDAMLGGGLPAKSTTTVFGSPGVGKTLLGLQFLHAGARLGESGLYFGFAESRERIVRKAAAIGLDLAGPLADDLLDIQRHAPQEALADKLAAGLTETVRSRNVRRVFIDGFEGFRAGLIYPERVRPFASSLVSFLRSLGVTTLISEEIPGLFGLGLAVPESAAEVVDNIILLRHVEVKSEIRRLVSVFKMRDVAYDTGVREMVITPKGIDVTRAFDGAEAIATGVAGAPMTSVPGVTARRSKKPAKPRRRGRG